jgi:hypothetical protein
MECIETLMANLKIIGKIEAGDKLRSGQMLAVEPRKHYWLPEFFRRWMHSQSRSSTVISVNYVISCAELAIHTMNPKDEMGLKNITALHTELGNAKHGIAKLKFTYSDDPSIIAQLDRSLDRAERLISLIEGSTGELNIVGS